MRGKKMIDPQHAMKKFPSYARKVRFDRLAVASRRHRRRRVFNINRIAPWIAFLDLRIGAFAAIMNQKKNASADTIDENYSRNLIGYVLVSDSLLFARTRNFLTLFSTHFWDEMLMSSKTRYCQRKKESRTISFVIRDVLSQD